MTINLSDAAFRAIVEEAADAILLVDDAGCITFVNARTEELFGYARAELLGQRVEVLVPEDRRAMHVIHREVYQEQPERRPMGVGLELSGRRRDGSTFPIEISLSPFREAGTPLSVAVVRDVTRQRRAEETLRRSEERHRLLNERTDNIIFRYRLLPSPAFEYVSASVHERLGRAPEELYVDPELLLRIAHPDDRHVLEQALSASAPRSVSLRMLHGDDEVRWFELSLTVIRNTEGTPVALEGIARDVTDRREADEERLQLQSEVEMQLERNRIAGDLHDDSIQSLYALGLSLHTLRDDEAMTSNVVIDRAIEGLNSVIESLRVYMHRLSGDGDDAETSPLAERLAGLVDGHVSPRWQVELDTDLRMAEPLERDIYLLAKELVSNVQRHAQAATAQILLRADPSGQLELLIADDGVGFDRAQIGDGSFGLRSVELRVATLGARLDVESQPGKGTRVRIRLPLPIESEVAIE